MMWVPTPVAEGKKSSEIMQIERTLDIMRNDQK